MLEREQSVLRGGGLDQGPQRYKRLPEVLADHGDSVRTLHTLTPLGVALGHPDQFDPWKD